MSEAATAEFENEARSEFFCALEATITVPIDENCEIRGCCAIFGPAVLSFRGR
jgi:hypothetical protein